MNDRRRYAADQKAKYDDDDRFREWPTSILLRLARDYQIAQKKRGSREDAREPFELRSSENEALTLLVKRRKWSSPCFATFAAKSAAPRQDADRA